MSIWPRLATIFRRRKSTAPQNPSNRVAKQVIACARAVSAALGTGMTEVIYENALAHALRKAGLTVSQKPSVSVCYDGMIVGNYVADLLVEHTVLIELTTGDAADTAPESRHASYLKATGHALCLLVHFGNRRTRITRVINRLWQPPS
jgi:GxxExxY protein